MLSLEQFSELAAIISAMADVYLIGRDTFSAYLTRRMRASDYQTRGQILLDVFSTYTDDEVDAIEERIKRCRDRFIREGSGNARRKCICSVLSDVKAGNGGTIPVGDWKKIYDQLKC